MEIRSKPPGNVAGLRKGSRRWRVGESNYKANEIKRGREVGAD